VPSKIVKILAIGAVSAGQRPVAPLVSAPIQHALSEMNSGFGSAPCAIGAQGAGALQSADEGGQYHGPDCPYPAPVPTCWFPGCRLRVRVQPRDSAVHALLAEGLGSTSMRSTSIPSPVAARTAAASSCMVSQRFRAAGVSRSRTVCCVSLG
jgi:hypothetical protein